jgi:hypothetical protein
MYNILLYPSIYAHMLNAFLLLGAVIILYQNYDNIKKLEPYKIIILFLMFSLVIGVHGLSHLGLEVNYDFMPYKILYN